MELMNKFNTIMFEIISTIGVITVAVVVIFNIHVFLEHPRIKERLHPRVKRILLLLLSISVCMAFQERFW
jgi:hypothetical protein